MMTNLDASNQQLFLLKEKLEKAREQATNGENKLSELQTKKEKLMIVAQNYDIDTARTKDYINASKVTRVAHDRAQIEAEAKIVKI